ncbi:MULTISPECIES: hypothetical protein [Streptomyces]|uniref:Uncharacterized protein n=1 Tax=Streptomyces alboflavus TaxID=67267 RepID=A0A1Z1WFW6_9ACTN|nr:hypothetical protein [Streptomyces alboflavus]ARX85279.1 hypothetical protein SMD44_04738 [Streptomyces alboflavus]
MDTALTVAVILALIALGAFVIHRLNAQHADRIAQRQYSGRLTGRPGARGPAWLRPDTAPPPAVRARRGHRDGDRGRLRPRRKANKATKGRRA